MSRWLRVIPGLVTAALVATASSAWAGIETDTETLVVGDEVRLTVTKNDSPLSNQPLKVTYYPNSEIKRIVELGRTDDAGRVSWRPDTAGLAALSIGDQSRTVAVRFTGMPTGALIVFLIAGSLLFGGIVFGVSRLRRPGE